jgi:hypothetical protein
MRYVLAGLFLLLLTVTTSGQQQLYPLSPIYAPIPAGAVYTRENRVGSFRPTLEAWECPVYRVDDVRLPVRIVVDSSGRVENWPIPREARPASGDDGHMCVIYTPGQVVYEFWRLRWQDGGIRAGGAVAFPFAGTGISDPPFRRVTASGFSNTVGMVKREDVTDDNFRIRHALTMALPWGLLGKNAYVPPAVGGEVMGSATVDPIPLGARFALPADLNVDVLPVDPFVRELLRAARDYGIYVVDGSGSAPYRGLQTGILEVETGLLPSIYGRGSSNDSFASTIQQQVYEVIREHGLWRVTAPTSTSTPTPTSTSTPTPTSTSTPTPTSTSTPTPTSTSTPTPTSTSTPTPVAARWRILLSFDIQIIPVEGR